MGELKLNVSVLNGNEKKCQLKGNNSEMDNKHLQILKVINKVQVQLGNNKIQVNVEKELVYL